MLADLIAAAGQLSPALAALVVIGFLVYIVYLLIGKTGPVQTIANNHLHEVLSALVRMEETLGEIRDGINFLKGRMK